jgi:integrase
LKWSEVDLDRGFIRFEDSKTGAKIIPISGAARSLISELPRLKRSPHVFPSTRNDGYFIGTPKIWREVRDKARLKGVRMHDLRHTFASIAAESGLSLPMIGALLGHSQASTTARYAHLADNPLRQASDLVNDRIQGSFEKPAKSEGSKPRKGRSTGKSRVSAAA